MSSQFVSAGFLYRQNEFLVALVVFVLFLAATDIGFRCGRGIAADLSDTSKSQVTTLQAAVMGLLALLLAFSFAMADARFAVRQRLVVDEANAISTTNLRAWVLPEPYRNELAKLLRDYLDIRIAYHETSIDPAEVNKSIVQAQTKQRELWSEAVAAVETNTNSPLYALFMSSLNDTFDIQAKRAAARENHVPEVVFYLLFFVASMSMALVGLGCGIGNRRHFVFTTSVAILIALVILVIMDLDRPRRGLIEVSQESMMLLRDSLR